VKEVILFFLKVLRFIERKGERERERKRDRENERKREKKREPLLFLGIVLEGGVREADCKEVNKD